MRYRAKSVFSIGALFALITAQATVAFAQGPQHRIVESSGVVLDKMMGAEHQTIPHALLADAQAVAVIPNVLKGGFVVGARHGKGVLILREEDGRWRLPIFISLTGGNIGWQVGVQSTDLILVFKTRKSIDGILGGKLTLGADASAAAGPIGRKAAAATDGRLQAEIYSYSRSRGLFAGVSIDGSVLRVERNLNTAYYQTTPEGDATAAPQSAVQLVAKLSGYYERLSADATDLAPQETFDPAPSASVEVVRRQLTDASKDLFDLLEPSWREYLAIPAEAMQAGPHPSLDEVRQCVARHVAVTNDPRYAVLTQREEFRRVFRLLQEYQRLLTPRKTALQIPPPPAVDGPQQTRRR